MSLSFDDQSRSDAGARGLTRTGGATTLAAHPAFRAASPQALSAAVESRLAARCITLPSPQTRFAAVANQVKLPSGEFWYCAYDAAVTLEFPEGDYLRVQFPIAGAAVTRSARQATAVTADQGCISSAIARIEFGAGFEQLVWRVRRDVLSRKLAALTGGPPTGTLEFAQRLSFDTPGTRLLMNLLQCTLRNIADAPGAAGAFMLTELEQLLVIALLKGTDHTQRALIDGESPRAAPWFVRRVEEYIEAHWDKPFQIEDAVALTGTSARTIYRAFRQTRGYSPLAFSKQRRLCKAREMLLDAAGARTVMEVACACGFGDISHFSRDFSKAFGEAPSAVLRAKN